MCSGPGCENKVVARGLCAKHYKRFKRAGVFDGKPATGLLFSDKPRTPKTGVCQVSGCDRPDKTRGWCGMHYQRWQAHGDPLVARKKSPPGTPYYNRDGYVLVHRPAHPNAQKHGAIFEHVLVMSEHLGRPLRKNERVHHKNGRRYDNSVNNLELWVHSHPSGQRVEDLLEWAHGIIDLYGDENP